VTLLPVQCEWRFERTSHLPADAGTVWRRVVSPAGIDDELRPWLTMSLPRDADIDAVALGEPLGRVWLRLGGLVPVEYDDLVITELDPGRRFLEESSMAAMRRWVHERTVEPAPDGGARVTDRITYAPRVPVLGPALRPVLVAFFAHRHRRLARHFG
jgi:hypothetical protein